MDKTRRLGGYCKNRELLWTGGFNFEDGTHIAVDSGGIQLSAAIARTLETCAIGKTHVAAPFANEPSVQTESHGPELNSQHAIGTAHNLLGHKKSRADGESKDIAEKALSPLLSPSVGNEFISE